MTCSAALSPEVQAFVRRFCEENGVADPVARWREIERAGAWHPTHAELTWGAKVAWRHSVRCVGRLYWEALEVRDLRELNEAQDVYGALRRHLDDAFWFIALHPRILLPTFLLFLLLCFIALSFLCICNSHTQHFLGVFPPLYAIPHIRHALSTLEYLPSLSPIGTWTSLFYYSLKPKL